MKSNKLSKSEFARALKLGHGRVLLHLREHGDEGFEEEIEDALVNSYVYDQQVEGARGVWLCQILSITGHANQYAKNCFERYVQDNNPLNQIHQIVMCANFFEIGCDKYRPLMLKKFSALYSLIQRGPYCSNAILNCCGLAGLGFIIEVICNYPDKLDKYYCSSLLEAAKGLLDEYDVEEYLKNVYPKIPNSQAFIDICEKLEEDQVRVSTRNDVTLQEVLDALEAETHSTAGNPFKRFGKTASDEEIGYFFDELLKAQDIYRLTALFRIFHERALPEINESILRHVESDSKPLSLAAAEAISKTTSDIVRAKAIALLNSEQPNHILRSLELLRRNYKSSDAILIAEKLRLLENPDDVHGAGCDILDIAETNFDSALVPIIMWMYENNPETWCRYQFIELLHEWNVLPLEILYESQFDAGDIVQLFARNLIMQKELS